jgi:transposase-like protein
MPRELKLDAPTPQQKRVLAALTQGSTITQAATDVGVDRTTVHYWCRTQPAFRNALERAKEIHGEAVRDGLRVLSQSALAVIKGILDSDETLPVIRLRAALAVLHATGIPQAAPAFDAESAEFVYRVTCDRVNAGQLAAGAESLSTISSPPLFSRNEQFLP